MTDPIADMLTRIRNALAVGKREVVLPYSRFKHSLAGVLLKHNLIEAIEVVDNEAEKDRALKMVLRYSSEGQPVIQGLRRVSRPGQRIYARHAKIPRVGARIGVTIVSTSQGLMTDFEARKKMVGGEVICQIW